MALPKVSLPKYKHKLVGMNKEIEYRPFTNQEQKILLLAKEGEEKTEQEILNAVKQVITNCTFGKVDVSKMPTFDLEDLFLRIRAKSVGEIVVVRYAENYEDEEGAKRTNFIDVTVDLNKVKLTQHEDHDKTIILDELQSMGVVMQYPSFEIIEKFSDRDMAIACIESVFTSEEVISTFSKQEIEEFFDDLPMQAMLKIKHFFDTMPVLEHSEEVTLKNGEKTTVKFRGLESFFV